MQQYRDRHYFVEVGEHPETSEYGWDLEDTAKLAEPDGLIWSQKGRITDSLPEAEARSILFAKTYKNVRVSTRGEVEVLTYVGD